MGEFTYPHGMAGTKRIQHAINGLKNNPDVTVRVVLQRQSSSENELSSGVHEGTPYETVMGDLLRAKMVALLPLLYLKTIRVLKKAWRENCKNVIYYYGQVSLESIVPLFYSRNIGYRIIFDIVEDSDVAKTISGSLYHRVKMDCLTKLSPRIHDLASGIVVISSHLEKKYNEIYGSKLVTPVEKKLIL